MCTVRGTDPQLIIFNIFDHHCHEMEAHQGATELQDMQTAEHNTHKMHSGFIPSLDVVSTITTSMRWEKQVNSYPRGL